MKRIELTAGHFALVDDDDFEWLNQWKWRTLFKKKKTPAYASRAIYINGKQKAILMHRLILGITDPSLVCDHIDGNGFNNQRKNLREAARSQNGINKPPQTNSKYKGVYKYNGKKKYGACIGHNYKTIFLGYYYTEQEAAAAYNKAAAELYGQFAWLNIVD